MLTIDNNVIQLPLQVCDCYQKIHRWVINLLSSREKQQIFLSDLMNQKSKQMQISLNDSNISLKFISYPFP